MKLLALFAILFSFNLQAAELSLYAGKFKSGSGRSAIQVNVTPTANSLVLELIGSGWNTKIAGKSYDFICEGRECSAYMHELERDCIAGLRLVPDNSFIFTTLTPSLCQGNHHFRRDLGPTGNGRWKVEQKVNRDGVLSVTALVSNSKAKSTMYMQCTAPSPQMSMSLRVNPVLWRALSFSVNNRQETAKVIMQIGGKKFEFTDVTLVEENLVVRTGEVSAAEIDRLKKGNSAKFTFHAVNSAGEVTDLGNVAFSLKGSGNALKSLPAKCAPGPASFFELPWAAE